MTKSQYFEKSFFSRLLPSRYAFAVAPLCLHFFISVQAKEERPTPNPSLGRGGVCGYLHICNYGCSSASQKHLQSVGQRLERISKASRTHAEGNGGVNN